MVFGMGPLELMLILGIALLIFGPKNLPKLGKSLGQTVKNIREGMEDDEAGAKKDAKAIAEETADEAEAAVEDEVVAEDEEVKFCSKCGSKNAGDAEFCNKCGAKLS